MDIRPEKKTALPVTLPGALTFALTALSILSGGSACIAQQPASADSSPSQRISAVSPLPLPDAPLSHQAPAADSPLEDPLQQQPSPDSANTAPSTPEPVTLQGLPKGFLLDQKAIWTSPFHVRPADAIWLLPLAATTGVLIGSDHHTMTSLININTKDQNHFNTLSDAGVAFNAAVPGSMYLWSLMHYAPQARETGLLAGEALGDSLAVNTVFRLVTRRERPTVDGSKGSFFTSGITDSSFPSNHAVAAWSLASVVGEEYPGWLTRTAVYGVAAGVSVSRVLAEKHFPSDVLVGSATGWLIGHYVYRAHHDSTLTPWDTNAAPRFYGTPHPAPPQPSVSSTSAPPGIDVSVQPNAFALPAPIARHPPRLFSEDADPDSIGSPNVPMDSWVYPALARLAAMGFIPGQNLSIRPWTRQECLRQLKLAEDLSDNTPEYSPSLISEAKRLIGDLHQELETEPAYYESFSLDSTYARYGTIAGPAITDSYHFGQTWWNDYGRPLGRGSSAIAGYEVRGNYGRLFFYDRQEVQHDPGNVAETPAINTLFNQIDMLVFNQPTIQPIPGSAAWDRQRPIELYAGVTADGNTLSFGKQQLFWGPTTMGPISFSSNAEPTWNLRFVSSRPHPIPFFPSIGTYRFDVVLGKLSGHKYPERPWFNGQKASFNFGDNFEVSFTRWAVFWGVGHPITFHSFKADVFSFNSTGGGATGGGGSAGYGDRDDPGDRKSNFDFTWHLPFMSRLVTLYADAYSDDDPNPIDAPRRALWNPGIYFARMPFLPHMDLRVEAVSSEGLAFDFGGQHFFINNQYLDSNTNKGFLLGSAIGRDGRAIEARSGYWFSSKTRVEAGYRQNKTSTLYLPGGGTITDGFVNASWAFKTHWQAQLFAQHERFLIPSYMPGVQNNTSGWFQINWTPQIHLAR